MLIEVEDYLLNELNDDEISELMIALIRYKLGNIVKYNFKSRLSKLVFMITIKHEEKKLTRSRINRQNIQKRWSKKKDVVDINTNNKTKNIQNLYEHDTKIIQNIKSNERTSCDEITETIHLKHIDNINNINNSSELLKNFFSISTEKNVSDLTAFSNDDTSLKEKEEKSKNISQKKSLFKKKFIKPSVEEVDKYIKEEGYEIDADAFVNYYESKGWVIGKSPMKDWKAAVRTWVYYKTNNNTSTATQTATTVTSSNRSYPNGIKSPHSDKEHTKRLMESLVKRGLITEDGEWK